MTTPLSRTRSSLPSGPATGPATGPAPSTARRPRRPVVLAVLAALSLTVAGAVGGPGSTGGVPQAAATTPPAGTAPHVTRDLLPSVQIDGIVWDQVTVGSKVYVTGSFANARPWGAAAGTNLVPRANLLAYDIRTGALDTGFVHSLNAQGRTITVSPDGSTLYVGGEFTSVDGQSRSRVAAFSTSTGQLLPFAPRPNWTVNAIAATNDAVYLGGAFTRANGVARTRLAAFTPSGQLTGWAPTANARVRGLVTSPDRSRLYVGGSLTLLNASSVRGIGALDALTGATIPISASQDIAAAAGEDSAGIYDLSTDGSQVYAVSIHYTSTNVARFEGSAAFDATTGTTRWINNCYGDSYSSLPVDGVLYVAGHAHDCSAIGEFPERRPHLYALAYTTAATDRNNSMDRRGWNYTAYKVSSMQQWAPSFGTGDVAGQAVWSFSSDGTYLSVGGEFRQVNGRSQQGIARYGLPSVAPNALGPTSIGSLSASARTLLGTSYVDVTLSAAAFDPDDSYLTYSLVRDGNAGSPVATTTARTPRFWNPTQQVPLTVRDTSAQPGATYSYQLEARDRGGKVIRSSSVQVTVPR